MANSITATLGLDIAQFKKKLKESEQEQEKSADRQTGGSGGKGLLKSNARVAHSITNVTQSFLAGGSAADIFGASILGLEKSLRIPLEMLASLGVGLLVFEKIKGATQDLRNFNESVSEALAPTAGGNYASTSMLDAKLTKVKELQKQLTDSSTGNAVKTFLGQYGSFISSGLNPEEAVSKLPHKREAQSSALREQEVKIQEELTQHEKVQLGIMESIARGETAAANGAKIRVEYEEKIQAAIDKQQYGVAEVLAKEKELALVENDRKYDLEAIAIREKSIEATTGLGEAERLKALKAQLQLSHERSMVLDEATPNATPEKIAEHAHAKALENQIEEMERRRADAVEQQQEQNAITVAQMAGMSRLARQKEISLHYDLQIAQAQRDGNAALGEQLEKAKALALENEKIQEYLKTPAQRREERARDRHERHAKRVVEARERDKAGSAARGAHDRVGLGDPKNPFIGDHLHQSVQSAPTVQAADMENAVADGFDKSKTAQMISKNLGVSL